MTLINEYNTDVVEWNSGPGSTNEFKNNDFTIVVASAGQAQETLLGMQAPEDYGDTPRRSSEKFTAVNNAWYYKLNTAQAPTLFALGAQPTYQQALTTPHTITIKHGGADVVRLQDVYLVKSIRLKYSWYIPRSSSASSSSVDCRNPSYNYPGSRFNSKITCPDFCRTTAKGVWVQDTNCYPQQSGDVAGCCRLYYALEKGCVKVSKTASGFASTSSSGCVTGYNTDVPYTTRTATTTTSYRFSSALETPILQYKLYQPMVPTGTFSSDGSTLAAPTAFMPTTTTSSGKTFDITNLDFSVRLDKDPFIDASRITGGCSTCSATAQPVYGEACADKQCFGLTPAQKRQLALTLIIIGCIMCIFPCGLVCYLKNRGGGLKPPSQQAFGVQQQQQIFQQQPGGYPMQQPGQAYPMQQYPQQPAYPPQAPYAPQAYPPQQGMVPQGYPVAAPGGPVVAQGYAMPQSNV